MLMLSFPTKKSFEKSLFVMTLNLPSLFMQRSALQYQVSTSSMSHSSHSVCSHTRAPTQNSIVVRWKSVLTQSWVTLCHHISPSHSTNQREISKQNTWSWCQTQAGGLRCWCTIWHLDLNWDKPKNRQFSLPLLFLFSFLICLLFVKKFNLRVFN